MSHNNAAQTARQRPSTPAEGRRSGVEQRAVFTHLLAGSRPKLNPPARWKRKKRHQSRAIVLKVCGVHRHEEVVVVGVRPRPHIPRTSLAPWGIGPRREDRPPLRRTYRR